MTILLERQAVGADLDAVAGMLRGDPGSGVRLDVRRGGKAMTFPLKRAQFKVRGTYQAQLFCWIRSYGGVVSAHTSPVIKARKRLFKIV